MALVGEFTAVHGVQWKVEIHGAGDGSLAFPSDSPLTIEWTDKSIEEAICTSVATVKIESQSDREFIGLYTEKVGDIRLDIYREGALYWSGVLDPEFYEEPYSRNKFYDVVLTFSDFGQLNRLAYNKIGRQLASDIFADAISRLKLNSLLNISSEYISTYHTNGNKVSLQNILVDSANFYDEESEASNLYEAIESILQPLGLKMIQKNGTIYLFDINAIAKNLQPVEVYWDGTDSRLGVDKVFNNVKIIFSPYVQNLVGDDGLDVEVETSDIGGDTATAYTFYKGYHHDSKDEFDRKLEGDKDFTIFSNPTFKNVISAMHPISSRKIYGGDDFDTAAITYVKQDPASLAKSRVGLSPVGGAFSWWMVGTDKLYDIPPTLIPTIQSTDVVLRLRMPALIDVRYNPWRESKITNNSDIYERDKNWAQAMYIPFRLRVYSDELCLNCLCHYENSLCSSDERPSLDLKGSWVAGDYSFTPSQELHHCAALAYFNPDMLEGTLMTGGFQENHQCCTTGRITDADPLIASAPSGQYITYPPVGGYLKLEILGSAGLFSNGDNGEGWNDVTKEDIRWMLFKFPKIELAENRSPYNTISHDDIEYKGVLNINAAEDLTIDTQCGTSVGNVVCSRGNLMSPDGSQIHSLTRNGVSDTAENLLIGTLFSAYGSRHTKLSGTARINPAFSTYSDANTAGKFFSLSEEFDCYSDEMRIVLVEINQDDYKGV